MKKKLLFLGISLYSFGVVNAQDYNGIIKDYLSQNNSKIFKKTGLSDFKIDNIDHSESLQSDVVKIQQTIDGVPVYRSVATFLIKDNKVTYFNNDFENNYNQLIVPQSSLSRKSAFNRTVNNLSLPELANLELIDFQSPEPQNKAVAKVRAVYYKLNDNLVYAYEYMFPETSTSNYWDIVVDANTGEILEKINLNLSCTFEKNPYSREYLPSADTQEFIGPINHINTQKNTNFLSPSNATYNVFKIPLEAPTFGSRSLVSNPWYLTASPEGWHSDGTNGYQITRGNNVYAYEDSANTDTAGYSPDGGSSLNFDSPFDINNIVNNNRDAAITNLFYINNMVHDITYRFGFNEGSKNFQQNNFGKGGSGSDYVNAESQDGGGLDNANFATPADGSKPRMQMYLWNPSYLQNVFYNAPSEAVPRLPNSRTAAFGPALDMVGVTGNVSIANVTDGCTPLTVGSMVGKIGLIERGSCNFTVKVKNAQDAGAIAAIVYNAASSTTFTSMGGTDSTITIPSVLIENSEGNYIKSLINSGGTVNVTLKDDTYNRIYRDGSFDNGIIIHEYTHGISNRLTGTGYNCLSSTNSKEQMGEGWSDFLALMLTNQPGDNASVARGVGNFASSLPTNGAGIRPAKYSPDFTINNYTYARTNGMEYTNTSGVLVPDVHSIGFIWATILWDLHWNYVAKYGYASDVTSNGTSGSARVLQLVMDGMKLQGCNPTFVLGRNALIAADQNTTGGADKCLIWRAFAKRGVGVNASAGSKTNINDQVEDFTIPVECGALATNETINAKSIYVYPNPAKNNFYLKLPPNAKGKLKVDIYDASGKLVYYTDIYATDNNAISTGKLSNGVYLLKVMGLDIDYSTKLIIRE